MTTISERPGPPVFMISMWLALAGGAAAMSHQLLWTRRLIDLLGAGHEAVARVFGVFFLGIALGSAVAAVVLPRLKRPWFLIGGMELGIAVLAVPVALLPWWTGWLWPALGPEALVGPAGGWVKLLVSIVCLLPPSFLMGFFIPVVVREISRQRADGESRSLALYAANTLGGVAGLALTAGWAIHAFGLQGAMVGACVLNVVVACGCFLLGRFGTGIEGGAVAAERTTTDAVISRRICRGLAFFSGFSVLAVEVLLFLLLQLVIPVSFYGPAAMLALVILALAVAAGIAATPWFRAFNPCKAMVAVLAVSSLLLVVSPWMFHKLVAGVPWLIVAQTTTGFLAKLTILVALGFGLAVLAAGLVFPLTALLAARTSEGSGAREWGWLLAWNGVGALAGAELTYRFLLPAAGLHGAFAWVAGAYGIAAVWFAWRARIPRLLPVSLVATAAVALAGFSWMGKLPVVNPHVGFQVREVLSGREGVVAVVDHQGFGRGILLSNQYMLGTTSARWSQERQAHLPLLLHTAPESVAFLGVATGSTPAGGLAHGAVREVHAVELSPLVVDAARRHFTALNAPLFSDRRSRVIIEDGRTWFAASRDRYDVIAGDLFQPWGPGEGRLFSREHFLAVRDALRDGGIFCQWLPAHQLAKDEFEVILNTFAEVFGTVEIFAGGFQSQVPSVALVGWKGGKLDWAVAKQRCDAERLANRLQDPLMRHADGLALLHLKSVGGSSVELPINTLDNSWIELRAGRRQVKGAGSIGTLAGGGWLDWLRANCADGSLVVALHEAEAEAFARRVPLFRSASGRELWDRLPLSLQTDTRADWSRWPGTLRP